MSNNVPRWVVPRNLTAGMRTLALGGGAVAMAGLLVAPERVWANLLLAGFYLVGLGLAGLLFVAIHSVSGAAWATALRRGAEALAALIPAASGLILVTLVGGARTLYPFLHGHREELNAFQRAWYQPGFFLGRSLAYLAVWTVFGGLLIANARRQDEDGDPTRVRREARLSAAFLVAFGFTVWLASADWLQALDPRWASTIFGVYQFAGLFASGLAALVILTILLRRRGPLAGFVGLRHLHDLGKLLFAFTTFWMYIWFSQFMLIWYGNLPEEAVYFIRRMAGGWTPLFYANVLLNWVVPFVVLLSQAAKRNEKILLRVAVVVLVGRWLDLYLQIFPRIAGASPVFGPWEAAIALGALGAAGLLLLHALRSAPLVPRRDPRLAESLEAH
jgi:hypothetical protein